MTTSHFPNTPSQIPTFLKCFVARQYSHKSHTYLPSYVFWGWFGLGFQFLGVKILLPFFKLIIGKSHFFFKALVRVFAEIYARSLALDIADCGNSLDGILVLSYVSGWIHIGRIAED